GEPFSPTDPPSGRNVCRRESVRILLPRATIRIDPLVRRSRYSVSLDNSRLSNSAASTRGVPASKVGKRHWWNRDAERIHHGDDVDHLLSDRPGHWRQKSGRRDRHPNPAQRHPPECALQSDRTHAAAEVQYLVDSLERAVHDDDTGGLGCDV